MAPNVPEGVLAIIRQQRPDIADDIERVTALKRAKHQPDETLEDRIANDLTWLWDFEHQGVRLKPKEIDFVIQYVRNGFEPSTALNKTGLSLDTAWANPTVLAALHEYTKNVPRQWQINPTKVVRQLHSVVTSNISDVCDITPAGVVLKDFSQLPRSVTDAVQEVHEIRNAQGTQIRVKFYDKLNAANILLKVMDAFPKEVLQVEFGGLEEKLVSAMQRLRHDEPKDIEGELVNE